MVSRIKQLLDWQQLSPTQFADRIGIGRPVVSHILSERNKPSLDVVQRIIDAFPDLSLTWLLRGTGDMLAASPTGPASVADEEQSVPLTPAGPVVAAGPLVTTPVGAPNPVGAPPAGPVVLPRKVPAAPPPARFRPGTPGSPVEAGARPTERVAPPLVTPVSPVIATATPVVAIDASPVAEAATVLPVAPESSTAPPASVAGTTPATPGNGTDTLPGAGALLAGLGEPGKAIRRIVIFYRDGSFADYQPEG